ncbi:MAG TPA: Asp-tRNA(Asn)/Glu-tRNA(Gln) amidotransferase subunit GatB [Firmicutes bacterium]|nr:Asp-tRNA(Asn)/Glu-tRNA(Gln) amidotransferase subunit GatB [Bacillota bacterium]
MGVNYVPTIGIEVHAQLNTESKMYCACSTAFGDPPNTHTCPVCLGLPGSLPRVNYRSVILGIITARALGCTIPIVAQFARKNYFYPDLPKGYQISMYQFPIGIEGKLDLLDDYGEFADGVGIERVHLEEDTAKLFHESEGVSFIDYNRAGVPLIEIVSRPDITSAHEASKYLKELRRLLKFLGISNANMEEGSFRCEVNISLRPENSERFGTKIEIKNLNSFRAVERSIEYEIERQTAIYRKGELVKHETRGWDEKEGVTVHQRFKEKAPEYRYFPEPDLPDLILDSSVCAEASLDIETIPVRKVRSLIGRFGVPTQSADLLMSGIGAPEDNPYFVADFFEEAVERHRAQGTAAVNLLTGIVFEHLRKTGVTLDQTDLTPVKLAEITKMIAREELSSTTAKMVLNIILNEGGKVQDIVVREGLVQVSDEDELVKMVKEIIEENPQIVDSIKKGKTNAIGALVGLAMKKSGGQANPKRVNEILQDLLINKK